VQLSNRGVNVVALVRDAAGARGRLPSQNVTVDEGDLYQYATLPGALDGCDAVVCAASFKGMADPLGPFKVDFTVCSRAAAAAAAHGEAFVFMRQHCLRAWSASSWRP
jgi:uncharacterized protein YbjT (DUF2867 family)